MSIAKLCSIEGCANKSHAHGWCTTHYGRWLKHGDPNFIKVAFEALCSVEECERTAKNLGLCDMHYQRFVRNGDAGQASPIRPPLRDTCIIKGCERKHYAKGYCSLHYQRVLIHGTPGTSKSTRPAQHGVTKVLGYSSWQNMKSRCYNQQIEAYRYYGGIGVKICKRYRESFVDFYEDMGPKPEGLSLDRVKVDGHYSCGKCPECIANNWTFNLRWATRLQQRLNQRVRLNSKSGFRGVTWNKSNRKWIACITPPGGKQAYLGSYTDPIEAAWQYDQFAVQVFEEEARPNFEYLPVPSQ